MYLSDLPRKMRLELTGEINRQRNEWRESGLAEVSHFNERQALANARDFVVQRLRNKLGKGDEAMRILVNIQILLGLEFK